MTDTIGPDGPPLSTEGWENGVRFLGETELRQTIAQLRKDGAEMRRQRDEVTLLLAKRINEVDGLRAQLDEANQRAEMNHQACLDLLGQFEDVRCAVAASQALEREQMDARHHAIQDRCAWCSCR